ncbi:MAG: hypothetical protein KatS3mg131_1326 [Candidatus Tectimicrobiota bacterium]|nr:MAG: hypothetical protein KatS3mg131_1326 [Candidatus Tectomicrobia bacterium]
MPKSVIVGGIFGVLLVGAIVYLSLGLSQYECEVCVTFNGRTQCRSASGADARTATSTAHDNACAFLVSSKTEGILCRQTPPIQVSCQKR